MWTCRYVVVVARLFVLRLRSLLLLVVVVHARARALSHLLRGVTDVMKAKDRQTKALQLLAGLWVGWSNKHNTQHAASFALAERLRRLQQASPLQLRLLDRTKPYCKIAIEVPALQLSVSLDTLPALSYVRCGGWLLF